jgi:apolipoprotein N-acyltransferase
MVANPGSNSDQKGEPRQASFWQRLGAIPPARSAWLWLLIGFLLLPFTAWQNVIPLAAWLAPVFLLRFSRTFSRPRLVSPLLVLAYAGAIFFDWRHGPNDILSSAIGISMSLARGLLYMLPYLADRRIGSRLGSWGRWLVFPLAFTSVDWATSLLRSITTHGSPAYSQYPILPLVQVISITGMYGITFLIAWFASTINACWEGSFHWQAIRGKLALFAVVLVVVLVYGALRLGLSQRQSSVANVQSVKVGTVTNETIFAPLKSMDLGTFYQSVDSDRVPVRQKFKAVNDIMFERIEAVLKQGAQVVVTQETGGLVLEEDKPALLVRASSLAGAYHAYLEITMWVFSRTPKLPYIHNQTFLVDPAGELAWTYDKTYPVFGSESFIVFSGSGKLPILDTPYGRMSAAICNDLNFPALLRQAGQNNVDILIAPFNDQPEISTQDPAEAAFRTLENGVASIRAAGRGLSMVIDPEGRVLASQDYFTTSSHVMFAELPVHSERTIYSRIGDLFAYLCAAGLVVLTALALRRRKQPAHVVPSGRAGY